NPVVQRQLYAALGQPLLMAYYQQAFARHGLRVAQVLATRQDFASRRHYLNMRECLQGALRQHIVPVVNENDVVSVTELMFTDNDELAALLAAMLSASQLILLSDIAGVYDGPPDEAGSRVIPVWEDQRRAPTVPSSSEFGRGGIASKIRCARRAASLGCQAWISPGREPGIVTQLLAGAGPGTRFPAAAKPGPAARRWVAGAPAGKATLVVNAGAAAALRSPDRLASLLPVGVTAVNGYFERGDIVTILDDAGATIGYGRAEYGAETARRRLGRQRQRPLIHYNYLYIEA
ncbi:MAG: glutamate 5-kinase, partial [Pseudomonadota bacterium]